MIKRACKSYNCLNSQGFALRQNCSSILNCEFRLLSNKFLSHLSLCSSLAPMCNINRWRCAARAAQRCRYVAWFFVARSVDEVWGGSSSPVFCCSPYAVSIKNVAWFFTWKRALLERNLAVIAMIGFWSNVLKKYVILQIRYFFINRNDYQDIFIKI